MNLLKSAIVTLLQMVALTGCSWDRKPEAPPGQSLVSQKPQDEVATSPATPEIVTSHHVMPRSSTYNSLKKAGIPLSTIEAVVRAAKPVSRLDRIRPGVAFQITWDDESKSNPRKIVFLRSNLESLELSKTNDTWQAQVVEHPVTTIKETYAGTVNMNLWESAKEARMDPSLISALAEVFAWQVDFSRAVQPGDRWRLTVNRKMVGSTTVGWGPILAAEYENNGRLYTAVRFPQEGPHASYYSPDGKSLKEMFLRSPLKYARITSFFNKARFHPILKVAMPHNGVDYGAPIGTPIMAVGRGVVEFVGNGGDQGNMVRLRHNGIYETAYLHMSRYASLRKGQVVEQGQVIGYVGATGRATGPHLHFSFFVSGKYVDPLGVKFPSGDPIPPHQLKEFQMIAESILRLLPDWRLANHETNRAVGPTNI